MRMISLSLAAVTASLTLGSGAFAQCYSIFPDGVGEPQLLDGYDVSTETAGEGLMAPPPIGEGALGVLCDRDDIIPQANDFEVLHHNITLFLRAGTADETQVLALSYVDGNYVVRLPQGSINDEERAGIVAALEGFADGEEALAAYMAANAEE